MKKQLFSGCAIGLSAVLLIGCQGTDNIASESSIQAPSKPKQQPADEVAAVLYNQIGYQANMAKLIYLQANNALTVDVVDRNNQQSVISKLTSEAQFWPHAGKNFVELDLTELSQVGEYQIVIDGEVLASFRVANDVYTRATKIIAQGFYFNRASHEISFEYGGKFNRAAGHMDQQVKIHHSAASAHRPEGTVVPSPKGWYDAGDYNKYTVNSAISMYTMLRAYLKHPSFFQQLKLNIPEQFNSTADILDELFWQLDWFLTMQDPNDGGVYHKVTTLNFSGKIMPEAGLEPRYMIAKSIGASLDFAATTAYFARHLQDIDAERAKLCAQAAEQAYKWAKANPDKIYVQPDDVKTGAYVVTGDDYSDEWFWAAAELALTFDAKDYWQDLTQLQAIEMSVPTWSDVQGLGWISLAEEANAQQWQYKAQQKLKALAEHMSIMANQSAIKVSLGVFDDDFVWGSNGNMANHIMVLDAAKAYVADPASLNRLIATNLDYIFGTNPTGYSFVSGLGSQTPMHLHHRVSEADDVLDPVPGLVAGGPHAGQQDQCDYPSKFPALSYVDDWCSYATNETAINWNAPLLYAVASVASEE
ncbi:glycoside hydrolase family 9 domain-containing protein [Catenovulum agarivorans DS-2]|uniref:Endoglucanase n=1 Tax=Catenovulum agarivorans DS-2 TaxID=1328313 RepID=W7QGK5_9ALTE|nr:glycoside hydrolase family 9 protein [Catenovulum agarivorans]EWH11041.1 glycoside hydrolase family 9 domain-containing protein [Catenovulum agarivorans DS-2]